MMVWVVFGVWVVSFRCVERCMFQCFSDGFGEGKEGLGDTGWEDGNTKGREERMGEIGERDWGIGKMRKVGWRCAMAS